MVYGGLSFVRYNHKEIIRDPTPRTSLKHAPAVLAAAELYFTLVEKPWRLQSIDAPQREAKHSQRPRRNSAAHGRGQIAHVLGQEKDSALLTHIDASGYYAGRPVINTAVRQSLAQIVHSFVQMLSEPLDSC